MKKNILLKDGINELNPATISGNVTIDSPEYSDITIGGIHRGTKIAGMTASELMAAVFSKLDTVSFLHLTDTHTRTGAINAAIAMADNDPEVDFIIHTGDLGVASENAMKATCTKPKLLIWGNHDTYDTYNKSTSDAAVSIREIIDDGAVNYGAQNASYWYKDVTSTLGHKVRFIGFDEYENASSASALYSRIYTQEQIDWFINLLRSTPGDYFLVLVHHKAPERYPSRNEGPFIASNYTGESTADLLSDGIAGMFPEIIDKYTKGQAISKSYGSITVNTDFSEVTPATFLCHLCGHRHADVCEPLVDYPGQLMLMVTSGDSAVSNGGDVAFTDCDYAFNKVTLCLNIGQVVVERIGAKERKWSGEPYDKAGWKVF